MQMNKMNAKEFFIKNIIVNEKDFNKYIISKVYKKDIAEDILQEAYSRAWKRLDTLKDKTKAKSWMNGIIRNCIYEYWRKAVKDGRVISNIVETENGTFDLYEKVGDETDVLETIITNFETDLAYKTLMKTKEEYRVLIHMRYVECLSIKEIVEITGMKEKTITSKLSRALKKYRAMYFEAESKREGGK